MFTDSQAQSSDARWGLHGKRALITGAAVGIGHGIAIELGARGATVVVHHWESSPEETLSRLEAAGRRGISIQADLARPEECDRLIEEATAQLGGLDLLVNNAG